MSGCCGGNCFSKILKSDTFSLMPDTWIIEQCEQNEMITPFLKDQVRRVEDRKVVSYGCGSYGYDIRLDDKVLLPKPGVLLDCKNMHKEDWIELEAQENAYGKFVDIPKGSFILGKSIERFNIPKNTMVVTLGKSTYARVAVVPHITPAEPFWKGYLAMEIANNHNGPSRLYLNEGIAQLLFFKCPDCRTTYADRKDGSKYQHQTGDIWNIVFPRM